MHDHARIRCVCLLVKAVVLGGGLVGAAVGLTILNHFTSPQGP